MPLSEAQGLVKAAAADQARLGGQLGDRVAALCAERAIPAPELRDDALSALSRELIRRTVRRET
jgi:hypothetical protein